MIKKCLVICMVVLSGCSTIGSSKDDFSNNSQVNQMEEIPLNYTLFRGDMTVNEEQIFSLTDQQQGHFLDFYNKKLSEGIKGHIILSEYLTNYMSNFTYYGDTYIASDASISRKGNCMSLAVLSVAFAKVVGLEFDFREVIDAPIYDKQDDLILSSTHVTTRLFDPTYTSDKSLFTITRPAIVIDYFPTMGSVRGKHVSYAQFLSMFFRNIAADALVEGDIDKSFANAVQAYRYDSNSPQVLNLLAVIHRRKGDLATAEKIYTAALSLEQQNLMLLNNYILLLNADNRFDEANEIKQKLHQIDDPNPYKVLEQADAFKYSGEYDKAVKLYERVIKKAPYISNTYLSLYQAYLGLNNVKKAKLSLKKGLDWTYLPVERKTIKYKLYGDSNAI